MQPAPKASVGISEPALAGGLKSMKTRWYTRRDEDDVEKGPFDKAVLVKAVRNGSLARDTLVRREDRESWSTIREHPTFVRALTHASIAKIANEDRLGDGTPTEVRASDTLQGVAALAGIANLALSARHIVKGNAGPPEQIGEVLGTAFVLLGLPFLFVAIQRNATQQAKVRTFCWFWLVMVAAQVARC